MAKTDTAIKADKPVKKLKKLKKPPRVLDRQELVESIQNLVALAAGYLDRDEQRVPADEALARRLVKVVDSVAKIAATQRDVSKMILATVMRDVLATEAQTEKQKVALVEAERDLAEAIKTRENCTGVDRDRADANVQAVQAAVNEAGAAWKAARSEHLTVTAGEYGPQLTERKRLSPTLPSSLFEVLLAQPQVTPIHMLNLDLDAKPEPLADAVRRCMWAFTWLVEGAGRMIDVTAARRAVATIRAESKQGAIADAAVAVLDLCKMQHWSELKVKETGLVAKSKNAAERLNDWMKKHRHTDRTGSLSENMDIGTYFGAARASEPYGPPYMGDARQATAASLIAAACHDNASLAAAAELVATVGGQAKLDLQVRARARRIAALAQEIGAVGGGGAFGLWSNASRGFVGSQAGGSQVAALLTAGMAMLSQPQEPSQEDSERQS